MREQSASRPVSTQKALKDPPENNLLQKLIIVTKFRKMFALETRKPEKLTLRTPIHNELNKSLSDCQTESARNETSSLGRNILPCPALKASSVAETSSSHASASSRRLFVTPSCTSYREMMLCQYLLALQKEVPRTLIMRAHVLAPSTVSPADQRC